MNSWFFISAAIKSLSLTTSNYWSSLESIW